MFDIKTRQALTSLNMENKLKQMQSIAPEDYYEVSQNEIINDNIASLEKDNDDSTGNDNLETPTTSTNQTAPTTPAAPKKSRKSVSTKGKQPMKKQKLALDDEQDLEDAGNADDASTTSLGKFYSLLPLPLIFFFVFVFST